METYERLSEEPLDINLAHGPGRWRVEATVKSIPFFPGDYHAGLAVLEPGGKTEVVSVVGAHRRARCARRVHQPPAGRGRGP